jgi:hypothetical protein
MNDNGITNLLRYRPYCGQIRCGGTFRSPRDDRPNGSQTIALRCPIDEGHTNESPATARALAALPEGLEPPTF